MQAVVAGPPWLSDALALLKDGGVYAARPQCRRSRQSGRTSTHDDDIVHSPRLLLIHRLGAWQRTILYTLDLAAPVRGQLSHLEVTESAGPHPCDRRRPTQGGWLSDRLADRFGGGQVFKDVDSIQLGDDFVEVITRAVGSCDVLLALIGDRWLTITDMDGQPRLDDPDDFVRLEIEAALARNVRIIPILVDGANMPRGDELPASLAGLVRRQALELSPNRFEYDLGRLLRVLDTTLAEVRTAQDDASPISPSAAQQGVQDTPENDVQATAEQPEGCWPERTRLRRSQLLNPSTNPHRPTAKPLPVMRGRPRENVSSFGRSRTLRRLLIIGIPLAALLAIYLIIQLVLDRPSSQENNGAQMFCEQRIQGGCTVAARCS